MKRTMDGYGLIAVVFAALISCTSSISAPQAKTDLAGTWSVKSGNYSGTMVLHQSGSGVNGIWHTLSAKEVDTTLAGLIEGDTLTLVRSANGLQQKFVLTVSKGGKHVEGYGDGPGFKHAFVSFDHINAAADDSALKAPQQTSPITLGSINQSFGELLSILVIPAVIIVFIVGTELLVANKTGWRELARRYPYVDDGMTSCEPCWWLQTFKRSNSWNTSVTIGKCKVLIPRIGIPPVWLGASSQGLILKRNFWNFAHSPVLIPWNQISAGETNIADLYAKFVPVAKVNLHNPLSKLANTLMGGLCEINVSDPALSIVTQMEAAASVRRVMGNAFKFQDKA